VKASAETVIGCKRGTNRERWISDRTRNLIDDRKEAKEKLGIYKSKSTGGSCQL